MMASGSTRPIHYQQLKHYDDGWSYLFVIKWVVLALAISLGCVFVIDAIKSAFTKTSTPLSEATTVRFNVDEEIRKLEEHAKAVGEIGRAHV